VAGVHGESPRPDVVLEIGYLAPQTLPAAFAEKFSKEFSRESDFY
jgi:hypothetical protein